MNVKDTFFSRKSTLNCRGRLIDITTPKVFGILNVTPDSFYDGGKYEGEKNISEKIDRMVSEGADFIDIGACSSRPGAKNISINEEMQRLELPLSIIRKKHPDIPVSVDTYRSEVADFVIKKFEADIINDISAGELDEKMFETVASAGIPYIMMHMKGVPETMHIAPEYENMMREIMFYFSERVEKARKMGIHDIILDPGVGFGKNIRHNFQLLSRLELLKILELPVMVGLSRKSLIYKTLHSTPEEALNGTVVLNSVALMKGADFLRVHDVKEAKEAIKLIEKIKSAEDETEV